MVRRINSISKATNWTHKHHFIVQKTKKTYLTCHKNSQEKEQTGVFYDLKTCFYFNFVQTWQPPLLQWVQTYTKSMFATGLHKANFMFIKIFISK